MTTLILFVSQCHHTVRLSCTSFFCCFLQDGEVNGTLDSDDDEEDEDSEDEDSEDDGSLPIGSFSCPFEFSRTITWCLVVWPQMKSRRRLKAKRGRGTQRMMMMRMMLTTMMMKDPAPSCQPSPSCSSPPLSRPLSGLPSTDQKRCRYNLLKWHKSTSWNVLLPLNFVFLITSSSHWYVYIIKIFFHGSVLSVVCTLPLEHVLLYTLAVSPPATRLFLDLYQESWQLRKILE